jgi:hypothetical protein
VRDNIDEAIQEGKMIKNMLKETENQTLREKEQERPFVYGKSKFSETQKSGSFPQIHLCSNNNECSKCIAEIEEAKLIALDEINNAKRNAIEEIEEVKQELFSVFKKNFDGCCGEFDKLVKHHNEEFCGCILPDECNRCVKQAIDNYLDEALEEALRHVRNEDSSSGGRFTDNGYSESQEKNDTSDCILETRLAQLENRFSSLSLPLPIPEAVSLPPPVSTQVSNPIDYNEILILKEQLSKHNHM